MYRIARVEVGKVTSEQILYRGHDLERMYQLLEQERAHTPRLVKGCLVGVHLYDKNGPVCEKFDNNAPKGPIEEGV